MAICFKFWQYKECSNELIEIGPQSELVAQRIIQQIASALQELHQIGIVHRDVKLENIFIQEMQNNLVSKVVLGDFGLSKLLGPSGTSTPCGTFQYAAPEILMPYAFESYQFKVDLWALGCLLYTLLSGYAPFYDDLNGTIAEKIRKCHFEFHEQYWSNHSDQVKDLISNLLRGNPLERLDACQVLKRNTVQLMKKILGSISEMTK
jgi:serine/threonine protein kinase